MNTGITLLHILAGTARPTAGRHALLLMALLLMALLLPAAAQASLSADRQRFLKAEQALNKGDLKAYAKLEKRLKPYPLYADLIFKRAIQRIDRTSDQQAEDTLNALADTPLQRSYRKTWLKRLARQKRWAQYLKHYAADLGAVYECHYANALYQNGEDEKAHPITRSLWLVGESQDEACDPAFTRFRKAGQLSNELIWERIELAIRKGKTTLVKYLKKSLPGKQQPLADEWLAIRTQPQRALQKRYTDSDHPQRQQMLVYGIKRMALFEADKAVAEWQKLRDTNHLNENQQQEVERYLALRMTTQRKTGAVSQHQQIDNPDKDILEWGARAALQENDWQALDGFIQQLEQHPPLSDRWKYWRARAAEQRGQTTIAEALYHLLATDRGYHNFLAADRIGQSYDFNDRPLQFSEQQLKTVKDSYNVQRAHELYHLGRINEARREWYYLQRQHGDEDRQKLAVIAKQWGWHSQAILTIARADYYDDLSIRFPVLYEKELKREAKRNRLDPAWVTALIRQESAFQPDARSPAGARGLMQLMPGTGRHVARLLKLGRPSTHDLFQPNLNLKLGTSYLKENLKTFNDHLVLTTAAYNAGPHRVKKWLPDNGDMDGDAWAETIPFKETRGYVQRILSYASIYDDKLGLKVKRVNERLKDVPKK